MDQRLPLAITATQPCKLSSRRWRLEPDSVSTLNRNALSPIRQPTGGGEYRLMGSKIVCIEREIQ